MPRSWSAVDRVELLMRIADDSLLGGGIPAQTWAARALDLVDADVDPTGIRWSRPALHNFELMAGQPSRALVTAAAATRIMATQPDSLDKARVATQHAQILMYCDQYDESSELSYAARESSRIELGDPVVEVVAGAILGVAQCTLGDWKVALDTLEQASRWPASSATRKARRKPAPVQPCRSRSACTGSDTRSGPTRWLGRATKLRPGLGLG